MTRYRCLEMKLHTTIVDSALCGLHNDKYIPKVMSDDDNP